MSSGPDGGRPRVHRDACAASVGAARQNVSAVRAGRGQSHIDELEELHVQACPDAVEPVDDRSVIHAEGLDEGDAGVGDVVVGPLGQCRCTIVCLVDEVLNPVVEIGDG